MTAHTPYTPGPWHISRVNDSTANLLIKPIPGQVICEIDPVPEAEANACLIAAAPDLYAEALAALDCLIDQCGLAEDCELIVGLRAAIAKADGRAAKGAA